jgi:hypothetical protein
MKVHNEIRTTLRERRMIAKNGVFILLSLDLGECCRIGTKTSSESLKHGLHTTLLQARRQTQVGAMRLVKDSKAMHSRRWRHRSAIIARPKRVKFSPRRSKTIIKEDRRFNSDFKRKGSDKPSRNFFGAFYLSYHNNPYHEEVAEWINYYNGNTRHRVADGTFLSQVLTNDG